MKVIALVGNADTGKSHTINTVYSFLLRDGYLQVPGNFRVLGNPKYKDFIDVIELRNVIIGFVGMGDFILGPNSLKSLLRELEQLGCHIAICGCRDIPKIVKAVTDYPNHHLVPKTSASGEANQRIVNVVDAERMISFI